LFHLTRQTIAHHGVAGAGDFRQVASAGSCAVSGLRRRRIWRWLSRLGLWWFLRLSGNGLWVWSDGLWRDGLRKPDDGWRMVRRLWLSRLRLWRSWFHLLRVRVRQPGFLHAGCDESALRSRPITAGCAKLSLRNAGPWAPITTILSR